MAEQRFMTERSNAIGPRETAKDADVDFGHLAIWISRNDTIAKQLEVEQVNATGSSDPARSSGPRCDFGHDSLTTASTAPDQGAVWRAVFRYARSRRDCRVSTCAHSGGRG